MKIYLVRHAQSLPRDGMEYEQACQVALSPHGCSQATLLAKKVKTLGLEKIIASPLPRTKQTAEMIAGGSIPISYDERLVEFAPQRSAVGVAYKEARAKSRRERDFAPADGESFNSVANRFISVLKEVSQLPHQTICVVSHALIIEAALTKLFDLKDIPVINEATLTLLTFDNGRFNLEYVSKPPFPTLELFRKIKRRIARMWKK